MLIVIGACRAALYVLSSSVIFRSRFSVSLSLGLDLTWLQIGSYRSRIVTEKYRFEFENWRQFIQTVQGSALAVPEHVKIGFCLENYWIFCFNRIGFCRIVQLTILPDKGEQINQFRTLLKYCLGTLSISIRSTNLRFWPRPSVGFGIK